MYNFNPCSLAGILCCSFDTIKHGTKFHGKEFSTPGIRKFQIWKNPDWEFWYTLPGEPEKIKG